VWCGCTFGTESAMGKGPKFTRVDQDADLEEPVQLNPIHLGDGGDEAKVGTFEMSHHATSVSVLFKKYFVAVIAILTTLVILSLLLGGEFQTAPHNTGDTTTTANWADFHAYGSKGAVASDSATCSDMGLEILKKGGNAVDASITTALCLGVVSPLSSGIGGGCFLVFHNSSSGDNVFIDSREIAPGAATSHMFESDPLKAQNGGMAVAVLAEVKGLYLAWQRHGSGLPWKDLVLPVATVARRWVVSPQLAAGIAHQASEFLLSGDYPELSKLYVKNNGKIKVAGDVVEQPALAETLTQIAEHGPAYLYDTMAATLAVEIRAAGGIVTEDDIRRYEPIVYPALESRFMGYRYVGAGGSSSGGAIVAGILNYMGSIAEPLVSQGLLYTHRLVEGMKHGFAMRLHLADPEYVNTTDVVRALLSVDYMSTLQEASPASGVLPLRAYGGRYNLSYISPKDSGTTHLSVVDSSGNAVALTSTINTYFGSKVVSPSTGILFNNQMDDFSIPGASNYFNLAPSPFNYPAPYKRPLSSMSPSIILDDLAPRSDGKVRMVAGGSGGPRIITATLQVPSFTWCACRDVDALCNRRSMAALHR
jgi:gamma-glutamyltranspeptidase/glutathione hydrolase/leukotriene-C4 hydrolase